MDADEKKVLRRKTPIIAEILDFSRASQKLFSSKGILTDDMIPVVMKENTKQAQMFKYLDLLGKERIMDSLKKLMQILEQNGFRWLCYEMKADIKAEKKQLQIEEYVYRETGIMVHAQFGKCKRISEIDKKEIQLMMSWRYQVAKEAWREQMETVESENKELEVYKDGSEDKMKVFYDMLKQFIEANMDDLDPSAGDLLDKMNKESENNVDEVGKPIKDQADMLKATFDTMIPMLNDTIERKKKMGTERKKCEELLEMRDPSVPLDIALASRLNQGSDKLDKAMEESENVKEHSQSVFKEFFALKANQAKASTDKDRKLESLEAVVRHLTGKNKELMVQTSDALTKKKDAETHFKTWKERCIMLEKTRKLGYFNPGWYDQLYGICDIHYVRDTENKKRPPTQKIISPTCRCSTSQEDNLNKSLNGSVSLPTSGSGTPGNVSSRSRGRGDTGQRVPRGRNAEYSTVHSLNGENGTQGSFVLKKNNFSSSIDVVRESNETDFDDGGDLYPKCNMSTCNYIYDSSTNCDHLNNEMLSNAM